METGCITLSYGRSVSISLPKNQMVSVRIPAEELERLDRLASLQGSTRSQLIQEAIADLISKSEVLRNAELWQLQKRLGPVIEEQCRLLDTEASFSDEYRRF